MTVRNAVRLAVIMLLAAAVALLVTLVVAELTISEQDVKEFNQYLEEASAFCNQTTGNPDVYTANVVGEHAGIHCEGDVDGPHLHQYPRQALRDAYLAEQSGQEFNPSRYDAMPVKWLYGESFVLMALLTLVGVFGVGLVASRY